MKNKQHNEGNQKYKRVAAVLSVVLALVLCLLIYTSEYNFTNDKDNLAAGITEFIAPFEPSLDACVLETKEVDDVLFASFKDQQRADVNGVAVLAKGLNQRYRIISAKIKSSDYSSVLQIFPLTIKKSN